jgi:hypothetical protein
MTDTFKGSIFDGFTSRFLLAAQKITKMADEENVTEAKRRTARNISNLLTYVLGGAFISPLFPLICKFIAPLNK